MPNRKISQLNINTNPTGDNILPIVASGETMQISLSAVTDYVTSTIPTPNIGGSFIVAGGAFFISGLTYGTSYLTYVITGIPYSAAPNYNLVVDSGDVTYDRLDLIIADISGNTSVVTGIPSANPVQPDIDEETQVQVALISVPMGTTSLATPTTLIYNSNVGQPTEWNSLVVTGPTRINPNAVNTYYTGTTGTTSVRFSSVTNGDNFILSAVTAVSTVTQNTLEFAIKNTAAWAGSAGQRRIRIRIANNGIQLGNYKDIYNGQFGFSSTSTAWQLISIPISAFASPSSLVQAVGFQIVNTTGNMSFNLDYIRLVTGIPTVTPLASWFNIVPDAGTTVVPSIGNDTLRLSGGTNITTVGTLASKNVTINLDQNIVVNSISATTYLGITSGGGGFSGWTGGTGLYSIKANNDSIVIASGAYSYAEGNVTTALGSSSHAEGGNTTAYGFQTHAEGNGTKAFGNISHVEGSLTVASGTSSHAEGNQTTSIGVFSHAEGQRSISHGATSHAEGNETTSSGSYSHTEGNLTTASGQSAHAEGESTIASGQSAHAEGYLTTAVGQYSHAEGQSTTAIGVSSHAEGQSTVASGDFGSHAEGNATTASGSASHAEGSGTTALGQASHAGGISTTATTRGSFAYGYNSIAGSFTYDYGNVSVSVFSAVTISTTDPNFSGIYGYTIKISGVDVSTEWNNYFFNYSSVFSLSGSSGVLSPGTSTPPIAAYYDGSDTYLVNSLVASAITLTSGCTIGFDPNYILPSVIFSGNVYNEWVDYIYTQVASFELFNGSGSNFTILSGLIGPFYYDSGTDSTYITYSTLDDFSYSAISGNVSVNVSFIQNTGYDTIYGDSFVFVPTGITEYTAFAIGQDTKALGPNSYSEGYLTTASGESAHAEGFFTKAIGGYGNHAEGNSTTSSGPFSSHAEGVGTTSTSYGSHSEGGYTIASGVGSHSEGYRSTATGDYSHTEGYYTTASANASHAEGGVTKAIGTYSHAEGLATTASGSYSHAEGTGTTASANASHAEGLQTKATGIFGTHAEGYTTTAEGYAAHSEGYNTTATGNYGSHAEGSNTIASGENAHAEGLLTVASGLISHAEGQQTTASGVHSHAEGNSTTASAQYSHAEGTGTKALEISSHAEGNGTWATGLTSHAEGTTTTAGGTNSHAEGSNTKATGTTAHAEGTSSIAGGSAAHAEGTSTIANGSSAHAEGNATTASGTFGAHAEGRSTIANGQTSHAEGRSTTASGLYSHAQGHTTIASGESAHCEGESTTAGGYTSHAEGFNNRALGTASHVEGQSSTASGTGAHCEGENSTASGQYSHAEGNSKATGAYSHSEGLNSRASGNTSHAEGAATTAFGVSSHSQGSGTTANGDNSHAEGDNTTASGNSSHAEGTLTLASGDTSHSEGSGTTAVSLGSHAEGIGTTAHGVGSHAEGNATIASSFYSHAEGQSTTAQGTYSHAGGFQTTASGNTSFIHSTNSVAGGARSAVIGGQNITGTTDDTVYVPNLSVQTGLTATTITGISGITTNSAFISAEPDSSATTRGYGINTRNLAGLTFPVPTLRPTTANTVLAFDLMPNGVPTENANGFTWMDICSADILNSNSASCLTARVAIHSSAAEFGSRALNGAADIPLQLKITNTIGATLTAAGKFMLGGKTGAANYNLDIHQQTAAACNIQLTNANTGTGATDGLNVGIDATGNALILQREALDIQLWTGAIQRVTINSSGRTFFGGSSGATALVHLAAGSSTASTAPFKYTSGTSLTVVENGAKEYDGTDEFLTANGTRQTIHKGRFGSYSSGVTAISAFTVTIGVTQPNTTYKVNVTPTAALSAALFYVTNKTTTTFNVNYLANLTGTVTFDWLVTQ